MTWWQWVLAYLGTGLVIGTIAMRAMWASEYKNGTDDGEWTNEYYGVWILASLGWPCIGPVAACYWLHHQGVFKAILTPTAIKKAKK